jgi:hypothetical protein
MLFIPFAILRRIYGNRNRRKNILEVVWGTEPLLNYRYWSLALKGLGIKSTSVSLTHSPICDAKDFDRVLFPEIRENPSRFQVAMYVVKKLNASSLEIIRILRNVDVVGTSLNGYLLSHFNRGLFNYRVEDKIFKFAGVERLVIPMGGEAWIYRRLNNSNWLHGLLMDYPEQARLQNEIAKRVDYMIGSVDYFLPGLGILDGFGRSDLIYPNPICIDTDDWAPSPNSRVREGIIYISHTPNHRQVKGTQKIKDTVESLKTLGYPIELLLIENTLNSDLKSVLREKSDIHIDQLYSDGYALSAIEAMSLGICTLTSFEGPVRDFYNKWSFTSECPLISITEENLQQTLIDLIMDDEFRVIQGSKCRDYVVQYHSFDAFQELFLRLIGRQSHMIHISG